MVSVAASTSVVKICTAAIWPGPSTTVDWSAVQPAGQATRYSISPLTVPTAVSLRSSTSPTSRAVVATGLSKTSPPPNTTAAITAGTFTTSCPELLRLQLSRPNMTVRKTKWRRRFMNTWAGLRSLARQDSGQIPNTSQQGSGANKPTPPQSSAAVAVGVRPAEL